MKLSREPQKSGACEPRHQVTLPSSLTKVPYDDVTCFCIFTRKQRASGHLFRKRGEKSEMKPRSSQREQYPASALKRVTRRYRRVVRATDLSPGVTTGQAPVRTVTRQTPPAPPGNSACSPVRRSHESGACNGSRRSRACIGTEGFKSES